MLREKNTISNTSFNFEQVKNIYHGKVRDVYDLGDKIIMIATDRISAFDHILPKAIPYKGQVLNQLNAFCGHSQVEAFCHRQNSPSQGSIIFFAVQRHHKRAVNFKSVNWKLTQ